MKALILIQDELINKFDANNQQYLAMGESHTDHLGNSKKPEDRMIVLCIAYHNIAVEQEFLK